MRRLALLAAAGLAACARPDVEPRLAEPFPERLSAWRLFVGPLAELRPNRGVVFYDVGVPLFSDHALKHRTLWMPPGLAARYRATGAFDFPQGTIFTKTFYYEQPTGRRLVETRLLVLGAAGWVALPYVWNEAQTDAQLEIAGEERRLVWTDEGGTPRPFTYLVPNSDQCAGCHVSVRGHERPLRPLGPTARQLNIELAAAGGPRNQLAAWRDDGLLLDTPPPDSAPRWGLDPAMPLERRARAYLDVQCAHCHSPSGPAASSGLYLAYEEAAPERLGVCKPPVAAGRGSGGRAYDIVPGWPDESILFFRMQSQEPDVMMPELGRSLRDDAGLALVRDWIASLPGRCS
jgi:uncharacterized repeat protein (TIGR03806 family)